MKASVDIVLLSAEQHSEFTWEHGRKFTWNGIDNKHLGIQSDYVFFWDASYGQPNIQLLNELTQTPVDAWHCGLKTGLEGLPAIMNYVDPTWMYNIDASADTIHTNFRLSLRCSLIRTNVFNALKEVLNGFLSIEMGGIALGYAILKAGGIIRYHPMLLSKESPPQTVPYRDEWVFARKFYSAKWFSWILLNDRNIFKNLFTLYATRGIKRFVLKPFLHHSGTIIGSYQETVSVLAPTLKRYEYLRRELEQLQAQKLLPLEVLITDQTSIQERELVDATNYLGLHIHCFIQEETGQCVAWNKLLEEAKGDYVLFLGDDADGITPDFIERLLSTMKQFGADMVASNVIEVGSPESPINYHYHLADTFPITLIKRELLLKTGFMDMFFNKNIRADHDLAMRCHLNGALMIFNPSAIIYHHRAMTGGLRTHKARTVTNNMVKKSLTKFTVPTSSEIYLVKKYYNQSQFQKYIRIKFFNQLFISGGLVRKVFKTLALIIQSPVLYSKYKANLRLADKQLLTH